MMTGRSMLSACVWTSDLACNQSTKARQFLPGFCYPAEEESQMTISIFSRTDFSENTVLPSKERKNESPSVALRVDF